MFRTPLTFQHGQLHETWGKSAITKQVYTSENCPSLKNTREKEDGKDNRKKIIKCINKCSNDSLSSRLLFLNM